MERLLAHPPSLPLVHVDHSHRASPALTGKFHREDDDAVLAEYIVVTTALEQGRPDHVAQFLYSLSKSGTAGPRVSMATAKVATENIRLLTEMAAKHCRGWASAKLVDPKSGGTAFLVYVDQFGQTQWTADNVKEHIEDNILHFLTEHYREEDGPKFIITHNDRPRYLRA